MRNGLYPLLAAQSLTAFADNAILFTAIAMVMHAHLGEWYVPALQSSFLIAFVVFAPWVGRWADRFSKPRVLIAGNLIKIVGTALTFLGVEPMVAYAVIGLGAAVYSPAKYGILPEMVGHNELVKANGWIEGSTILAIIAGTVVGGYVADRSIHEALLATAVAYGASIAFTTLIPKLPARGVTAGAALPAFVHTLRTFLVSPRARFAMLGTSLFWGTAAVVRLLEVAWAPMVLMLDTAFDVSKLTLYLAIGIVVGAASASKLIPIEQLRRARGAAYIMGGFILILSTVEHLWPARGALFAIGMAGGIFVVPVNAALQEIGHKTVGSGGAVAIQQFFENAAMLVSVGIYTVAAAEHISPVANLAGLGLLVMAMTFAVAWHLPKVDGEAVPLQADRALPPSNE
ncbi:MAG: lysophospholipid transporter LplT [Gammaproteobacteria bacterium]